MVTATTNVSDVERGPADESDASIMDNMTPGSFPGETDPKNYNYLALVLGVPLILVTILGNVLVCLSVLTERSLKTATNYFIISLAAADLLLAVLVLPLFIYSEFLGGVWTLSSSLCDALMTMDVMLCTASILNLCAISVDRYIAVVVPLKYNRNQFSVRQLALITAAWVLSLGVASPVVFGLNRVPGRDPTVCKLEDERFVVYSSVCSFFVPCPVMLLLYYWMFRGLRRWSGRSRTQVEQPGRRTLSLRVGSALRRAKAAGSGSQGKAAYAAPSGPSPVPPPPVSMTTPSPPPVSMTTPSPPPVSMTTPSPPPVSMTTPSPPPVSMMTPSPAPVSMTTPSPPPVSMTTPSPAPVMEELQDKAATESDPMTQMDSVSDGEATEAREGGSWRENGLKTKGGRRRGRRNSKSSRVSGRERKAMKVLPVVVGVFLACWTPFFVVHVTKVSCPSCDIGPTLVSVVTWLGYVNSAVNPVIYTAFNAEFRNVFHKLLCCRT